MKLLAIIKKNFKILIRNRLSTSIIVLGPILILILVASGFNTTSFQSIRLGIHSVENTELLKDFLTGLKDADFYIKEYKTEHECRDSIVKGISHMCLSFSADKQRKIKIYVDFSRYNLVWALINSVSKKISESSSEISLSLTAQLLDSLKKASGHMQSQGEKIKTVFQEISSINEKLDALGTGSGLTVNISDIEKLSIDSTRSKKDVEAVKASSLNDLDETEKQLEELETKTKNTKEKIEKQNEELKKVKNVLDSTYADLGCSSVNHEDLSPYVNDEDAFKQRLAQTNQECSILLTSIRQISKQIAETEAQIAELNKLLSEIGVAKGRINSMRTRMNEQFDETISFFNSVEKNTVQIRTKINDASQNLSSAQKRINDEIKKIKNSTSGFIKDIESGLNYSSGELKKIDDAELTQLINPYSTTIEGVSGQRKFYEFMVPVVLVILITFVGILVSSTLVIREKTSKAFFRNMISPSKDIVFLAGIYLTALIVMLIQLVAMFFVLGYVIGMSISGGILIILLVLVLSSSAFIFIGMIIGNIFKTEEIVILTAICLIALIIFFSGAILPTEGIKAPLNVITKINPFFSTHKAINKLIIAGQDFSGVQHEIADLSLKFLVFGILAYISFKKGKRNSL